MKGRALNISKLRSNNAAPGVFRGIYGIYAAAVFRGRK